MVMSWHRPVTMIVDKEAIKHNIKQELSFLDKNEEIFGVVKADGYGHGAVEVAKAALEAGVSGLCVSNLDEALELRENAILASILVLGVTDVKWASLAQKNDITLTVASFQWVEDASQHLSQENPLKVHLKIDTGMHRIGFNSVIGFTETVKLLEALPQFLFEGMFTHFATADEENTDYFDEQVQIFKQFIKAAPTRPRYIHCANSATAIWHKECSSNIVRLGLAMYGLNPSGHHLALPYPLYPALSLEAEIVFVKQVTKGGKISYGATYEAKQDEWIGTLPIGYADGWNRSLQGFKVLVEGEWCEIVGRICMDQCMIRLPKQVAPGTKATLIGKSGKQEVTATMAADYLETISYELVCALAGRVARVYK